MGRRIALVAGFAFDGLMDRRVLILPVAAAVIAGLVLWRLDQEKVRRSRPRPVAILKNLGAAPSFLLTTQNGGRAKLAAYLGRTKIVLLFTGGGRPLADSPELAAVAEAQAGITAGGAQLVVVTTAPPQEVRRLQESRGKPFSFPILSDIDPELGVLTPAHQMWGLVDGPEAPPRSGLFLIDRAGFTEIGTGTETSPGRPVPVGDFEKTVKRLGAGEWPM
ncbi:MAG TPA: redoxin domain-containing protein [Caulifigura sp.]|nr:redoxin domain-containing protein [Caulifigura sp.]